ncbi:MAG: hypothetical protein RSD96_02080 [Bacilli bacterium]
MNVIISNKYTDMLKGLDVEVIKSLEGEFEVDELISTFDNFYFNKMILDITAVVDYQNINTIQKLSISFDVSKLIILLDNDQSIINNAYLSKLVSVGIYNFTRNLEGVKYLYEHPNQYRDVAHIQNLESQTVIQSSSGGGNTITKQVIGVKNLNDHAGATSFIYMMKKILSANLLVKAIEIDKRDFIYFDDKDMISTTALDFPKVLLTQNEANIVLVDLNEYQDSAICNDVLYLMDPGVIKVNKMLKRNSRIFEEYKNKKIILNRCALTNEEVSNFEYEARTTFFDSIPNIEMRRNTSNEMLDLLDKLGLVSTNDE